MAQRVPRVRKVTWALALKAPRDRLDILDLQENQDLLDQVLLMGRTRLSSDRREQKVTKE